jgi:hypothetical protein
MFIYVGGIDGAQRGLPSADLNKEHPTATVCWTLASSARDGFTSWRGFGLINFIRAIHRTNI